MHSVDLVHTNSILWDRMKSNQQIQKNCDFSADAARHLAYDKDKASRFLRMLQPLVDNKPQAYTGMHCGKKIWRFREGRCSADSTHALRLFPPLPKESFSMQMYQNLTLRPGQAPTIPYCLPPGSPGQGQHRVCEPQTLNP